MVAVGPRRRSNICVCYLPCGVLVCAWDRATLPAVAVTAVEAACDILRL